VDANAPRNPSWDDQQIEAWIAEARGGSTSALGELLEACRTYLLGLANRRVSSPLRGKVSASDLVQETSIDAHRDFGSFRGQGLEELLAWLRQILLYNASSASRRYERTRRRDASREIPFDEQTATAQALHDDAPSPRAMLIVSEEQQLVQRAIARLPDDYQTVILLRSHERYSFAEIGCCMDRTAEAARKLWFRAIERLQQELADGNERI
jgi:RNA polymerase sigma-70 factor (ECF subfamily)